MKDHKIGLIGFGNVGQGFATILKNRGNEIAKDYGVTFQITDVSDIRWGTVSNPQGIPPADLLEAIRVEGNFSKLTGFQKEWDSLETIKRSTADSIIELSPTDLATGEPAVRHIRAALESGKNAVTTNKGPIALEYCALSDLARKMGRSLGVEGTVMSGTPSLRLGSEFLAAAGIRKIQGIINGTTNYILTQMQAGKEYADALAEAQAKGYAEADPTGDVEGHDAAGKLVILAAVLMGASLKLQEVDRVGITKINAEEVNDAANRQEVWKLIASVERKPDGSIAASVRPKRLPEAHPLAAVKGATNAITFTTDLLGEVTLIGPGAGRTETGYAILEDLLAIERSR